MEFASYSGEVIRIMRGRIRPSIVEGQPLNLGSPIGEDSFEKFGPGVSYYPIDRRGFSSTLVGTLEQ